MHQGYTFRVEGLFVFRPVADRDEVEGLAQKDSLLLLMKIKVKFDRNVLKIMFLCCQEIITELILGPPINNVDVEKETQVKNTKKIKSYIHYVSFFLYKKKSSFFDVAAVKFPSLERYISSIPAGYRYIFIWKTNHSFKSLHPITVEFFGNSSVLTI
jgi:hypothetical protein